MYTTCCRTVIQQVLNLVHCKPMSKSKDDLAETQIHGEKIEVPYVQDTLSHGDKLICQIWDVYVRRQISCGPNTKPRQKP